MDISFGDFNNILDASSITFKQTSTNTSLKIDYNHSDKKLTLGDNIVVNDKVIVNKSIAVTNTDTTTVTNQTLLLIDGTTSANTSIEMNIGDKIEITNGVSPKPLYITSNNKNNSSEATPASGVVFKTGASQSSLTEHASIGDFDTAYGGATIKKTIFTPTVGGIYYINYYSDTTANPSHADFYIPITVSDRFKRNQQIGKDLSFNENISVHKNLSVLGNSNFTGSSVFSNANFNGNTVVSNIQATNSSFDNLNCSGNTDLSDVFMKNSEAETLITRNPTISNRTLNITVDPATTKFKIGDLLNSEASPVINIGDTVVFNQTDSTNYGHSIVILDGSTHRAGGASDAGSHELTHNNTSVVLKYYLNGSVVGNSISDYLNGFNTGAASGDRKVEFKTTVPGKYYYQCSMHTDMGGMFTVVDRDRQTEVVAKDISFNGNIDVDFSSNYVSGVNKRFRFIFHPDYN